MILNIPGPLSSASTIVSVDDIIRLETSVLSFFGEKLYNLYIIVKADDGENFHLFSYVRKERFEYAFATLSEILANNSSQVISIQMEPYSEMNHQLDAL